MGKGRRRRTVRAPARPAVQIEEFKRRLLGQTPEQIAREKLIAESLRLQKKREEAEAAARLAARQEADRRKQSARTAKRQASESERLRRAEQDLAAAKQAHQQQRAKWQKELEGLQAKAKRNKLDAAGLERAAKLKKLLSPKPVALHEGLRKGSARLGPGPAIIQPTDNRYHGPK